MYLLVGYSGLLCELLLRNPEHRAALSDSFPDMAIQILGTARATAVRHGGYQSSCDAFVDYTFA